MLSRGIRLSKNSDKLLLYAERILSLHQIFHFLNPVRKGFSVRLTLTDAYTPFFDCFGGDEISIYLSKLDGCAQFEGMIEQFYENQWHKCRRSALSYLKRHKNDSAAIRYLFLCENNIKNTEEKSDMESIIL